MVLKTKIQRGVLAGFLCFGCCVAMLCVSDSAVAQEKGESKSSPSDQEGTRPKYPTLDQEQKNGEESDADRSRSSREIQDLLRQAAAAQRETPKTAEELLKRLDSKQGSGFQDSELAEQEAKKAVTALRERYPFQSVRDRLGFHPDLPAPSADLSEEKKAVDGITLTPKNNLRWKSSRELALRQLHSKEALEFVNRSGNGVSRRRIISPYDLPVKLRYATRLKSRPVDSGLLGEPLVELKSVKQRSKRRDENDWSRTFSLTKNGMPYEELTQFFHGHNSIKFAGSDTTGYVKSIDEVAGFEPHRIRFSEKWSSSLKIYSRENLENQGGVKGTEIDWKVNRLQLVSLLLHDEPRVYNEENLPNMEELSGTDVATRALDAFEQEALEKLQAGEDVVTRATPNRIIMLGSMRATQDCMRCHAVKENSLLGAFSYEFLRDPKLKLEKETDNF